MSFLELRSLNKIYLTENKEKHFALCNFSLILPSSGLIAIVGKSGSGKSTLLNLIALLDEPDSGEIFYQNENIYKWKKKRKNAFRNHDIGIVFQHYQLLEDESAIYNVMLPMLISGMKEKDAEKDATLLLEGIGFPKSLYPQKCCDLSGGEKERIAILRSLINNPKILLADEPTGALDSANSGLVMEILKRASKTKLVIVVSHNQALVEQYADRIVRISDGKLESNKIMVEENNGIPSIQANTKRKNNNWVSHLSFTNLKRRLKRNIAGAASLMIGLVSAMLIMGFSIGAPSSIKQESLKQLDYGALTISKEITKKIEGSSLSLVQTLRPTEAELYSCNLEHYYVEQNYDALFSQMSFAIGEEEIENLQYCPIYDFDEQFIDASLIVEGKMPSKSQLNSVIVNQKAYSLLHKANHLSITSSYQNDYYTQDTSNPLITDNFIFEKTVSVSAVVKEMNFLSSPKIYYSYLGMQDYLSSIVLNNLSTYEEYDISWSDLVSNAGMNETISSYSFRLFLKDIQSVSEIQNDINQIETPLKITSSALTITETLLDLVNAATMGMEIFLIIALVGTALILGILSYSAYVQDKKKSAILLCLGATSDDIMNIYSVETLSFGLVSLFLSFILAPLFAWIVNAIIFSKTGFAKMVNIPFLSFLDKPLLFPLICLFLTILICLLSTCLPIQVSKKISLKEELADE